MAQIVGSVSYAVVRVAAFPYIEFAFQAEGEPALNLLQSFFEGDFGGGCEEYMNVIGHDDECVEIEAVFCSRSCRTSMKSIAFCSTWKRRRREAVTLVTKYVLSSCGAKGIR